jgi:Cu(I)/Ag(I) efflux system membrane fusion protein
MPAECPRVHLNFHEIMKNILLLLIAAVLLVGCGKPDSAESQTIQFYQSPMHPWIKSDEPGSCTICGMALVPVYEGDQGFDASEGTLALPESTIQVVGVRTAPVEDGTLKRTLRLAGVIDDDAGRHQIVSAHFDGRVDKPFIEQVGEEVRKGQPLAEIYSPELLYVVREYQRAKAGKERGVYDVAARRLIQFGLTPGQLDAIAVQPPDQYGINLLSPMTGTVIKRFVSPGQYVKTGDPLFELGDFSKMWFHATVYESDLPLIHLGQEAQITTPAAPGRTFDGIVTLVDPNFDPATRSTTIRIEVPNPLVQTSKGERRALPHRAFGEARMETEAGRGLLVPRSAVLDTGAYTIVYVDKGGGAYERRPIQIAARGETHALVSSGLAAGERVVTNGNLLMDGESQMKDSGAGAGLHDHSSPSRGPAQQASVSSPLDAMLIATARVGAALAADDLAGYQEATKALHSAMPPPPDTAGTALRAAYESFDRARHLGGREATLADARAAFLPLSEAAADLARELQRENSGAAGILVFACPMTESAFPGAPPKARWIQSGEPLRNPWFGAGMLECGAKIQLEAMP